MFLLYLCCTSSFLFLRMPMKQVFKDVCFPKPCFSWVWLLEHQKFDFSINFFLNLDFFILIMGKNYGLRLMVTTQFLSGFFYGVMEKKLRSMETSEGGLRQAQPPD